MAEKPTSEKTEKATPHRLMKARQEGQVAQSAEFPSAIVLLGMLVALAVMSPVLLSWLAQEMREGLTMTIHLGGKSVTSVLTDKMGSMIVKLLPLGAVLCGASALACFAVGGWAFSLKSLKVKFGAISPINGLKQLISLKSLVNMLMSLAKFIIISIIVVNYLRDQKEVILYGSFSGVEGMVATIGRLLLGVSVRILAAVAAIGLIDLLYQKWQHTRQLRMTKQEVKEERKQYELPMEVKSKQRSLQIRMAKRRMLQKVKTADVVIVNPTHFAVALQYDPKTMSAPVVVAKGADHLALKIKEIAAAADVPVVERPELARAIFRTVDLDQPVPAELYVAVAEILAMIYRLRKKRAFK